MMVYCTQVDVIGVARIFSSDFNRQLIQPQFFDQAIAEASEIVRYALMPRYDLNVINAYSPDFPPAIVSMTKLKASMILFHRYLQVDGAQPDALETRLYNEYCYWEKAVVNGTMLDTTGTIVPASFSASLSVQPTPSSVRGQYQFGLRLYPTTDTLQDNVGNN